MTGNTPEASKSAQSFRLLCSEQSKKIQKQLETLAKDAVPVDSSITEEILLVTLDGEAWLCLSAFYARRAVGEALKERGFPTTSTSNCIVVEKYPQYIRADLFNDSIQSLIMAAGRFGESASDALVQVVTKFNDIKFDWPTSDEQSLDFASYFVLMTAAKGKRIFDRRLGCAVRLNNLVIRQSHSGPEMVFSCDSKIIYGTEIASVSGHVTESLFETSNLGRQRFVPLDDVTLKSLIEVGKTAASKVLASETTHGQMKGVGFVPGMMGKKVSVSVNGRVIHDPCGCHEMMPSEFNGLMGLFDLYIDDEGDISTSGIRSESDYAEIMTYSVFYDLSNSRWFIARFDELEPINFRADAFEQLVLDSQRKSMIHAIVKNRSIVNAGMIDGKGAGAIFLLAGEPGCGKTMTAEAVAEAIQKPLFKVNLGTLSSNIEKLEARLSDVLQLSARWDAVLLIDEADAYMEARDSSNLHRNALVAVFLRLLEYYAGVLFLTTNRANNLDTAFWSRITMAFHYPKLGKDGLSIIWSNMLRNVGIKASESEIEHLLSFEANGREIGNAINAAQSLAIEQGTPATADHIASILSVKKQFMDSIAGKG